MLLDLGGNQGGGWGGWGRGSKAGPSLFPPGLAGGGKGGGWKGWGQQGSKSTGPDRLRFRPSCQGLGRGGRYGSHIELPIGLPFMFNGSQIQLPIEFSGIIMFKGSHIELPIELPGTIMFHGPHIEIPMELSGTIMFNDSHI